MTIQQDNKNCFEGGTMEKLNITELMQGYAAAAKKWCLLISISKDETSVDEAYKAAPYLKKYNVYEMLDIILTNHPTILSFDTEEEMLDAFHQTVGDEGPTETNSYSGPANVYALTCSNKGELLSENT